MFPLAVRWVLGVELAHAITCEFYDNYLWIPWQLPVNFVKITCESRWTVADESIHLIEARGAILTRIYTSLLQLTLVDVQLAVPWAKSCNWGGA